MKISLTLIREEVKKQGNPCSATFIWETAECPVLVATVKKIENTSWKALAYGIYARVVDVSEIERVSSNGVDSYSSLSAYST